MSKAPPFKLTPLEKLEDAAHKEFTRHKPSRKAVAEYLAGNTKTLLGTRMDFGISIAIAGLIVGGWAAWEGSRARKEAMRMAALQYGGPNNRCPDCRLPPVKINKKGHFVCENKHAWPPPNQS